MIGLIFLAVVFFYIFLSKFIVAKVYEKTKSIKKKNIAIAIMILIPTWDVILGFPIYAYLCAFESGTKIYKTVDNVEGFYIGERGIQHEPHEPYEGYKYIEYKEMDYSGPTGKYYRSYWVDYYKDRNATELCVYPNPKYPFSEYARIVKTGNCIVKEEIAESEISRWELAWANEESKVTILGIFFIKGNVIKDSKANSTLAEDYRVQWSGGWVNSLISGIHNASLKFTSRSVSCNFRNLGTNIVNQTLKNNKEQE